MLNAIRRRLGAVKRGLLRWTRTCNPFKLQREIDALYALLYELTHDWDGALDLSAARTREAFATQWETLPEGRFLLSDPWFRENAHRILWEEEIQVRPDWFRGRYMLDAGCGNGRWSYALAKLGANVTAVDVNRVAVDATQAVLKDFHVEKEFYVSPLEELSSHLPPRKYDLVFSWGVLHHCQSFTRALKQVSSFVADEGLLYIYLYGCEAISRADELEVFKERVHYNTLSTDEERYRFLLKKAGNRKEFIHGYHDAYAPLVNRRLEFEPVRMLIEAEGFEDVTRTLDSPNLCIRAIRGNSREFIEKWVLPKKQAPYWYDRP